MKGYKKLQRELALKQALEAIHCKRSFYQFVRSFWDIVIADEPVWNWHIEYLCDELEKVGRLVKERKPKAYDLIINVPPGTTKSTICTVMYPVWVWTIDPTQRFITSSHNLALSTAHASLSRDIIRSERYTKYFGYIEIKTDQDNKQQYMNVNGGVRLVASVGSSVTGKHGHQLIIDDPIDPEQANSEIEREKANRWHDTTLSTRKVNKEIVPTILIMQRLHEKDLTGHLLSKGKKIKHICLPAEVSGDVQPPELRERYVNGLLDPKRLSMAILDESKLDLGSYGYANQFMQRGAPLEGGIFKREWFEVIHYEKFQEKTKGRFIKWNFKIDGAYTEKTQNDPCGFWASCFFDNKIYIRNFEQKWLEQPEFVKRVGTFADENGYNSSSMIAIEPKANGISTVQTLQRETKLNVVEYRFPKTSKISMTDSKVTRAMACSPSAEAGRVVFIDGGYVGETIEQIINFPNASHDEAVDCMVMDIAENFIGQSSVKVRSSGML